MYVRATECDESAQDTRRRLTGFECCMAKKKFLVRLVQETCKKNTQILKYQPHSLRKYRLRKTNRNPLYKFEGTLSADCSAPPAVLI